jgi:hypothetical protein
MGVTMPSLVDKGLVADEELLRGKAALPMLSFSRFTPVEDAPYRDHAVRWTAFPDI